MSFSSVINHKGIGWNPDTVDVFVWNRNDLDQTDTSTTILRGDVVTFCLYDSALISGDGDTITPYNANKYGGLFANVTKSSTSTNLRHGFFGVALEDFKASTSTGTHVGGKVRVRGVVQAKTRSSTSTVWTAGYAAVIDITGGTSTGYLNVPTSHASSTTTAKVIALTLEAATGAAAAFTGATQWVLFDGINGFGGSNNAFNS